MAYRVTIPIVLGSARTGLTLTAKLYGTDSVQVGGDVSAGFTEIGLGNYAWDYSSIPADFRGWVKFYSGATLEAFTTIVPEDVELVAQIEAETDDIAAIKAATDNLPSDPADESLVIAATDAIMARLGIPVISVSADIAEVAADVDAVAAGQVDPWTAELPGSYASGEAGYILGQLVGSPVLTSVAPVLTELGDLELVKGQDYRSEDSNSIVFTDSDSVWPALGNASVTFHAFDTDIDMDVIEDGAVKRVRLNLEDSATADLPLSRYAYEVRAQLSNSNKYVLARGRVIFS